MPFLFTVCDVKTNSFHSYSVPIRLADDGAGNHFIWLRQKVGNSRWYWRFLVPTITERWGSHVDGAVVHHAIIAVRFL